MNTSARTIVCRQARIANQFHTRLIGLLGKRRLEPGSGLLIDPCSSIHTFGMAFPIDVVALDRKYKVLGTWKNVRPWRAVVFGRGTRRVLELPSGVLEQTGLEPGDYLHFENGNSHTGAGWASARNRGTPEQWCCYLGARRSSS
jgi:uncharacterized membrane protein (UPF0127 family)